MLKSKRFKALLPDNLSTKIYLGDCRQILAKLPAKSVHCVVTSPPYFKLRDYGTGTWQGGDLACDHRQVRGGNGAASKLQVAAKGTQNYQYSGQCKKVWCYSY